MFDASKNNQNEPINFYEANKKVNLISEAENRGIKMKQKGKDHMGLCPFHKEKTPSFSIYTGDDGCHHYQCFGCGESGDAVSFISKMDSKSSVEVASDLLNSNQSSVINIRIKDDVTFLDAKESASEDVFDHYKYGKPVSKWEWINSDGSISYYTARYIDENGKKQVLPISYILNSGTGNGEWSFKLKDDRIPMNLNKWLSSDDNLVVICEGEKTSDAVESIGYQSTCWAGGTNAINKTDWSYLKGKDVIYSHDNDEPGEKARKEITEILKKVGVNSLRYITIPGDKPSGWDLADASPEEAQIILERAELSTPIIYPKFDIFDHDVLKFSGKPEEQKYLVVDSNGRGFIPESAPIMIAGAGGVGKSTLAFDLCLKVGIHTPSNPQSWMGFDVAKGGRTAYITAEDSVEELHRKLWDLRQTEDNSDIAGRFFPISYINPKAGLFPKPFVAPGENRAPAPTEAFEDLRRQLSRLDDLAVIVIDNVGAFYQIEGNDYAQVNAAVSRTAATLAAEFNCVVILIAHTNKSKGSGKNGSRTEAEHLNSVMGSVGWVSAVRQTIIQWGLQPDEEEEIAKTIGLEDFDPDEDRKMFCGMQILKTNIRGLTMKQYMFKRDSGSLVNITDELKQGKAKELAQAHRELIDIIKTSATEGNPFTATGKVNGVYARRSELPVRYSKMGKDALIRIINDAVSNGDLVKSRFKSTDVSIPADRIAQYLDSPMGDLANMEFVYNDQQANLERLYHLDNVKEGHLRKLESEAISVYGRANATVFLNTPRAELGGKTPAEHCQDGGRFYDQAKSLIKRRK